MPQNNGNDLRAQRRTAMAVLVHTPGARLARLWRELGIEVKGEPLRGPETGLVMVRGRIGGSGDGFNIGEATITRATVRLSTGEVGHAYALGRDGEKAVLAATIDAALQRSQDAETIRLRLIEPLHRERNETLRRRRAETAATKVEFFTMVRGE